MPDIGTSHQRVGKIPAATFLTVLTNFARPISFKTDTRRKSEVLFIRTFAKVLTVEILLHEVRTQAKPAVSHSLKRKVLTLSVH